MPRGFALAVLIAAACGRTPSPAAPDRGGDALPAPLVGFRAATGGAAWSRVAAIQSHATIAVGGLSGTSDTLEDVASGRNRSEVALGTFAQAEGWDGTHGWQRTPGGEVVVSDAPPAVAHAKTSAWLTRRGFFHAGGATYRDLGTRDGLRGIEATPAGGAPIQLWFDAHGLLARTIERVGTNTVTTELSDYRAVGNVQIPFRAVIDQGDPRNKVTLQTAEAKLVPSPDAAAFAEPKLDAERVAFAAGAQRTQIPFELINNHIYIHASVDGKPLRMLVDTGGLNLLMPAAAKRLGLTTEGTMAAQGAGSDKVDLAFAHGKTLTVGEVTLANPVFYVVDLGKLVQVEGEDFDGLVGFELFSRLRVRIDYPGRSLALIAPAAFTPPAGAIAVPIEMNERTPVVQGSIDGVPGRFWIDTGSRSSLTTMAKFTRDHDLVAKYHPKFETVTGWGVGGATRSAPVRFHQVTIGNAVVHDVVGDLFTGDKGAFADPDSAANLGGGILHRFIVTFDYTGKVMYLEPRPELDHKELYDRSGLFLLRDGDALRVAATTPHGPAQAAGIEVGDRITAIDGAPVATKSLASWRTRLRDTAPGTKLKLHVERLGDVAITLTELVP